MASILASATAPYVSTLAGVLMPVRKIIAAPSYLTDPDDWYVITPAKYKHVTMGYRMVERAPGHFGFEAFVE